MNYSSNISKLREVPPYYAIGLFSLDLFTLGLGWISIIMYAYIIAPPDLVATMTAVVNTLMFVICESFSPLPVDGS